MGSLKAALKAFFPNNNGDTNFSSSCLVPYFDSPQNPKGCVTPSKLASVLGAFITKVTGCNFGNLTDLNFEAGTESGLYWSMCAPSSAPANLPSSISSSTRFLLVYLYTAYDRYQIVIDRSSSTPYGRYGLGNPGSVSWSSWKEL